MLRSLVPWRRSASRLPVRGEGREPFYSLQRNIDQLFDDVFSGFNLRPFGDFDESFGAFTPTVDVSENDNEIRVAAELPGLADDDIDVSLEHNVLTISGEKKHESEDKGENYHRIERSYGTFRRSIALPEGIDADKVDATFKNGVLTVTLPKTPEARKEVKKIAVKAD
jgi:HSP20 family protein